jgi:hypothetical protein
MDYGVEIKFCQRVIEYARWLHAGKKGEAPYIERLPPRYRLRIENCTAYNVRKVAELNPAQLYVHLNVERVPHIPLTEDSDVDAARELAKRKVVASGSDGGRSGGGLRLR